MLNQGNREAFRLIYERYSEKLAGFAAAKLYDADDAEDVLHDVFARLWSEREQLQITGNLQSYLFSAIRYRIVDKIRRNVTRQEYAVCCLSWNNAMRLLTSSFAYGRCRKLLQHR